MKESSHKSSKHGKESHNKRHEGKDRFAHDSDKYRNVLKERHYKDVSEPKRAEKSQPNNTKQASSKSTKEKDKSRSSEHNSRQNRHKPDVFSSSGRSEDEKYRNGKRQKTNDESYEELSRKKRKIESELHALDLEEAAAKQAESKKAPRQTSNRSRRKEEAVRIKEEPLTDDDRERRRRREEVLRIKEEPLTDDDRERRRKDKMKPQHRNQGRPQSPRSSGDDERGWGNPQTETKKDEKIKEKPNFTVSGKLAEDTNTYNGVVIKYNEPSEARKPKRKWRLYPFKGDSDLPFLPIHRQSAYLFGRTRSIADIPIDHPSCSKQHAVLQFRLVPYKRENGTTGRRVRPYIIDLESSNGTFVNNKRIDPRCYVELMEKDVVKFGYSSREYVILHEESKYEEEDDDVLDSN